MIRVVIPDSHGNHIDIPARDAFLADLKALDPPEIVMLGDHLDCAGTFSTHQRSYTNEMAESYEDDVRTANRFLDCIQRRAPRARIYYIEGNHEAHVERWAARTFFNQKDAVGLLDAYGPTKVLHLKKRGIRYYQRAEMHMGLSVPGTIRLGKCYFTHGMSHSKHAAATHLARVGDNIVFGHVHRIQSVN
jgi:predicted phosphodiesterase